MNAMFLMTANANPLSIEDNDRRIYYIATPNTFESSPQCKASESADTIYQAIMAQMDDIAYYLATEIKLLKGNDYMTAPFNSGKNELIFSSKNTSEKIGWALKHQEFSMLEEYLINPDPLFNHHGEGKIYLADLVTVYQEHSNNDDADKIIKTIMKLFGFASKQGYKNKIYYSIAGLRDYEHKVADIEPDEDAEEIRL